MSVSASVRPTLLAMIEEQMSTLIRDAVTIQRHCKRARYNTTSATDSNNSGNLYDAADLDLNPMNASNAASASATTSYMPRLHAADINLALQWQGSEKLYGVPFSPSASSAGSQQQSILLTDVLKEDMPNAPTEVILKQHWLAVDGLQPDVLENPASLVSSSEAVSTYRNDRENEAHYSFLQDATSSSLLLLQVHQLQAGLLSEELRLYWLRGIATLERGGRTAEDQHRQDTVLMHWQVDSGLQELVPFVVRYAQQAIYEQLTKEKTENADASSSTNNLVATNDKIDNSTSNIDHCIIMVRLILALLHNPTLHLELHLHELLPTLMTCIVAQQHRDGQVHSEAIVAENWTLRQQAATALYESCVLFGNDYVTLKARVLRALCHALEEVASTEEDNDSETMNIETNDDDNGTNDQRASMRKNRIAWHRLPCRYGGIVALTQFGGRAIDAFVLPTVAHHWQIWDETLLSIGTTITARYKTIDTNRNKNTEEKNSTTRTNVVSDDASMEMQIRMCQQAVLTAVGTFLRETASSVEKQRQWHDMGLEDALGPERRIFLSSAMQDEGKDESKYTTCFI